MKTQIRHREHFNGAHEVASNWACGDRLHGHDWYAEIVITGGPDPKTGSFRTDGPDVLHSVLEELNGRHLNEMVRGTEPTPEGLSLWLTERLLGIIPGLSSITVGFPDHAATVEV